MALAGALVGTPWALCEGWQGALVMPALIAVMFSGRNSNPRRRPKARAKPRTGKVRGRINLQRKIGPYLLVVLADFELVFALALALDWVNSLAPCWGVRLQSPQ